MPAHLPHKIKTFQKKHSINYTELLGFNPKTNKNDILTYAHHMLPSDLSGVINVCPGAGNCKKTCLHFAGNPAYMKGKNAKRLRQTLAFADDQNLYLETLFLAICRAIVKHEGETIAFRLNATSDIMWENLTFNLSPDVADFVAQRFGIKFFACRAANILELFEPFNVIFYDYTKLKRDWQKCRDLNYHLTVSFDGHDNIRNHKIVADGIKNGVNVAAAFNIKKAEPLPEVINLCGYQLPVLDGDISDSRFDDVAGCIIGLRFKQPRGTIYSKEDISNFCVI